MPAKKKKFKEFTSWDWEVTIAALRYYECGRHISAGMFPGDFVKRFFTGDYDDTVCSRLAHQFAITDHSIKKEKAFMRQNEDDGSWWLPIDNEPWLILYEFLKAYATNDFHVVFVKYDNEKGKKVVGYRKAFYCSVTKKWYPVEKYVKEPDALWVIDTNTIYDIGPAIGFNDEE